jgi:hypothetical protein
VRQHIAIQRIERGVVEVWLQHALTQIVEDDDTDRSSESPESTLVQLGPDLRARRSGCSAASSPSGSPPTEASVPSLSRRRAGRPGRIDGLKVQVIEGSTLTDVEFARALRMLARMMVRDHDARGDHQAIDAASPSSSALTVSPSARPDHVDDAA